MEVRADMNVMPDIINPPFEAINRNLKMILFQRKLIACRARFGGIGHYRGSCLGPDIFKASPVCALVGFILLYLLDTIQSDLFV